MADDMSVIQIESEFGIDNLARAERSIPDEPGSGEVLIRMRAASLNARDLLTVKGLYNPRQPLPLIPCSDGVGEVVAIGDRVDRVEIGDRVMPCFAQGWISGPLASEFRSITLGGPLDGTLAEYVLLEQDGVVRAPDYLSDEEAATLPCAAVTAWSAIVEQGQTKRGDTVVIQGTGGVALFALQFAAKLGARVIVTSKSDEKLAKARELGASETINYVTTPDWSKPVKQFTEGVGADHVVELGGSATLRQSVRAVMSSGFVSMIGVLGGPVAKLDLPLVVMRNVRLQGVTVGSRSTFEQMLGFMQQHELRPVVDRVFAFDQSTDAFRHLESAVHFGKICIRIE